MCGRLEIGPVSQVDGLLDKWQFPKIVPLTLFRCTPMSRKEFPSAIFVLLLSFSRDTVSASGVPQGACGTNVDAHTISYILSA